MVKHIVNIGDKFGRLTVVKPAGKNYRGEPVWECLCNCGNKHIVKTYQLSTGRTKSCGCMGTHPEGGPSYNSYDITGQRFGRWIVLGLSYQESKPYYRKYYRCMCNCGKTKTVGAQSLRNGTSKSCGCLHNEQAAINGSKPRLHQRKAFGESSFNKLLGVYKRGAQDRSLSFTLSAEEFKILTKKNCFYCNKPPSQKVKLSSGYGHYIYNGIDRVDNTLGYTIQNCVPCCKICNGWKKANTKDEFLEHIKRIYINVIQSNNMPNNQYQTNRKQ